MNLRYVALPILLGLSACAPEAPQLDVPPASAPQATPALQATPAPRAPQSPAALDPRTLAEFKRIHGSAYDPQSRADRAKMDALLGVAVKPEATPAGDVRQRVVQIAMSYIGEQETNGKNRSPLIDKMNALTGVPMGSPYCASFNAWCYSQAKVPAGWPRSAWSPDWVRNPTWKEGSGATPKPGDAFGIWFASQGRVAHTGLIREWQDNGVVITIEANTSPVAAIGSVSDRDGDGVWSKRRLRSQIYSVRNWIDK